MYKRIVCLCIGVVSCLMMHAAMPLSERAQIALLTCTPGSELYSRYGHTSIRVTDPANHLDVVFNYGCFSFDTDHFYYKFVKGETYYELGVEDAASFLTDYQIEHRPVFFQVLNLNYAQRQQLFDRLVENAKPQNCKYLYNFVFDNCATRPYYIIKEVIGDSILSPYEGWTGKSFREFIHTYTGEGSWEDFGINMVFGRRADEPMTNEQRLFLPEELMNYLSKATTIDGIPVVSRQFTGEFTHPRVPWYKTWYFGVLIFTIILVLINIRDWERGKLSWGVDVALGVVYLLLAALIIFLIFFSIHPLVGLNWRVFLFPIIHLCTRFIYLIH